MPIPNGPRRWPTAVSQASTPQAELVIARLRGTPSRELQPRETGAAIAAVADRVVREAVDGGGAGLPFAVIGMGKLGARS